MQLRQRCFLKVVLESGVTHNILQDSFKTDKTPSIYCLIKGKLNGCRWKRPHWVWLGNNESLTSLHLISFSKKCFAFVIKEFLKFASVSSTIFLQNLSHCVRSCIKLRCHLRKKNYVFIGLPLRQYLLIRFVGSQPDYYTLSINFLSRICTMEVCA